MSTMAHSPSRWVTLLLATAGAALAPAIVFMPDTARALFPICNNPAQHSSYSNGNCAASGQWVTMCSGFTPWNTPVAQPPYANYNHSSQITIATNKQRYKWVTNGPALSGCGSGFTTYVGLLGNNGDGHGWMPRALVLL